MEQKITVKTKLFYGLGQAGDTVPYTLFYTFFLIYLTDVVGIKPIIAGSISAIAILWNAVLDPIIGYLSDNCKSKRGRRGVFMGRVLLPYVVIIILLFFPIEGSQLFLSIYYVALGVAFWSCYTIWVIPYLSLVSDMTTDYNERNDLRMYNTICASILMAAAMSGPLAIQEMLYSAGYSEKFGWAVSGAIFAIITGICMLICWNGMRGKERPVQEEEYENIFYIMKKSFKLRAFRQVCLIALIGILGITLVESMEMYLFTNRLGLSEGEISGIYLMYAVVGLILVPILSKLCNKFGKREIFIVGAIVAVIGCGLFWQIGVNSYAGAVVYIIGVFSIFAGIFWLLYVSLAYDVAEIYAYKYGQRRDGSIMAIVDLAYKVGAAVASFLVGALLTAVGYVEGAEQQTAEVMDGINTIATLPCAIAFIVVSVIIIRYPVTIKRYNAMIAAAEARKDGRTYSEEEFDILLK